MLSVGAEADLVLCPYYARHEAGSCNRIWCEGLYADSSVCHWFRSQGTFLAHFTGYCQSRNWERCEYALALTRFKYGDEK